MARYIQSDVKHTYIRMHVYTYVCMYACMHVCKYVCVCVFVCVYQNEHLPMEHETENDEYKV